MVPWAQWFLYARRGKTRGTFPFDSCVGVRLFTSAMCWEAKFWECCGLAVSQENRGSHTARSGQPPHTPGGINCVLWVGGEPGKTAGHILRGAARSRTLQEGPRCCWTRLLWVPHCEERPGAAHSRRDWHTPGRTEVASVDLGTLRRHHGLWVWLTTCARGLADPLGRFCDTMGGGARGLLSGSCVWQSRASGWSVTFGRSGDTCVGWLAAGTSVLFGFARDVFATPCDGASHGSVVPTLVEQSAALQQSRGLVHEDPFAKGNGSDMEFICRLQEVTSPEASQKVSCGVGRWCECGACERGWYWCCSCGCGLITMTQESRGVLGSSTRGIVGIWFDRGTRHRC